ncbi:hypothetical protein [Veronia nyctiphanis]|uniref:hypothetical protein n=1 Tax=Veronia nyctiphanis TaxID=1278244 RepID=UPI0013757822|nr:hypothetical protein [Veronia nyctiphanis]
MLKVAVIVLLVIIGFFAVREMSEKGQSRFAVGVVAVLAAGFIYAIVSELAR